jgi:hypothetical protein
MKMLQKTLRAALLGLFAFVAVPAAQAQVNINVNTAPPSWGPPVPAGTQYYYIPETNSFYDVPARQYVVQRNGNWVRTTTVTGYNTSTFHPVVVDYVGAQPWVRYEEYKVKYPKKGHPHGMPPGQAKKMGVRTVPAAGVVYVEKQGKHDDKHEGKGHGKGKGKH